MQIPPGKYLHFLFKDQAIYINYNLNIFNFMYAGEAFKLMTP